MVGSLVSEPGLSAHGLRWVQPAGSVVVARGLSCSEAYGIFPDQGLDLCLLHWQTDSHPLCHQESSISLLLIFKNFFIFLATHKAYGILVP